MKDLNSMMRQAQAMQAKLQAAQAELAEIRVVGVAGGGLLKATLKGSGELLSVEIDPKAVDPDDVEMLGDLMVSAHADAKRQIDEARESMMRQAMGPLAGLAGKMPGLGF